MHQREGELVWCAEPAVQQLTMPRPAVLGLAMKSLRSGRGGERTRRRWLEAPVGASNDPRQMYIQAPLPFTPKPIPAPAGRSSTRSSFADLPRLAGSDGYFSWRVQAVNAS